MRRPPVTPLTGSVVELVHGWAVASAQQSRRNAMVATTACAQRRAERDDVTDFLDAQEAAARTAAEHAADVRRSHA